jgi:acetamidase/formamidase
MYYPVEVAGALLSMGDAHTAQGNSELSGTGIETSITGKFKIELIKKKDFNAWQAILDFPLGETADEFFVHSFTEIDYLETYAEKPELIFGASSVDKAMKNAFTQSRKFLMAAYDLSDAEATSIITEGVDFEVTQVVDGNFGVHSVIPKAIFEKHVFVSLNCPAACVNAPHISRRQLLFGAQSTVLDCSGCYEA